MKKQHLYSAGFTLIELLVASAVFTLVATNATMLFVSAMGLQYQSTGIVKISENAQFAMESIAREIRVSKITFLSNSNTCSTANTSLTIEHPTNGTVTYSYFYNAGSTMGVLRRNNQDITSPDVSFTKFYFCLSGVGPDDRQVRVTMPMTIESRRGKPSTAVRVSLQTTVSSRDITEDFSD